MAEAALEAECLSKRYGRTWALREVDLALEPGGVIGLVGPNGAGKSTLLKTWIGFETPTSGAARVGGYDPRRNPREVLSKVAYLAQSPGLYRDLTVEDHLDFVQSHRGRYFDRAKALRRVGELGLPLGRPVGTLSGGQRAQVGLAIALGLRAESLLLDEPLASLDPLARREFIDVLIDDLKETGATAVLSSHIVGDIEMACGRLILLGSGRVQLCGRVEDILADHSVLSERAPETEVVAELPGGDVLAKGRAAGRQATLEDVVLGYLAAGKRE